MRSQSRRAVRWQRTTFRVIVLTLLLMMASALVMAQKTQAANVRIKDGTWIGTTTRGKEISFKVKNYQVVGFIIPIEHSCPSVAAQKELGESLENKVSGFEFEDKLSACE